ncbi:DUF1489 family protein [Methylomonas sp. MK1]|jgi:hypothetical protein|uniref:DUF1489 family protein n=1 Tax=Methylomonas sp. MK1 TaxID=1131552 RepID=UPI00036B83EF|nr:DUF1489 domain-containing protein [Methylomonas sp. MK1]
MSKHIHLVKVAVGTNSFNDLKEWQVQLACKKAAKGENGALIHITRHTPKRAEELLDNGSIYWVIKGHIRARNRILELRPMMYDGIKHCGIVYDPQLIRVAPDPRRPFQGWRYLEAKDAPSDIDNNVYDIFETMLIEFTGSDLK